MTQWVERQTLGFGLGHDLGVMGLSPMSGSTLSRESDGDSLSFPPTLPLLILSGMNKKILKKNSLPSWNSFCSGEDKMSKIYPA